MRGLNWFAIVLCLCVSSCAGVNDLNEAATALERQQPDRAIELATKVIRTGGITPTIEAFAYTNRGGAYILKMQYDLAIDDLNHAISIEPNSEAAYGNRGAVRLLQRNYSLAISDFDKAIALSGKVPYLINRAVAYRPVGPKR